MRKWLIGCGGLFGVFFLACLGVGWWLTRPPKIELPTRQYPPNNTYTQYRQLGEEMHARFERDVRFKQIENALTMGQPVSSADRAYYLQCIEPYLRAYAPLTTQPCKAIFEYDFNWRFPEYAQMRRIARAESYLIREAMRQKRYADALTRIERLNRLVDQIRTDSPMIGYLVGVAINTIALAPAREELPRMQEPKIQERLLQMARAYETRRIPLWKTMEQERYFILSVLDQLARGELQLNQLSETEAAIPERRIVMRFLVNRSLPEFNRLMDLQIRELQKPFHERDRKALEEQPKQLLNGILFPVFSQADLREMSEVATMRLIGCTAAIRLHKLRTGRYPASLEALKLGAMCIDPFTGAPFRYQVDPKRGFLLYSVGANRVDDGGAVPYGGVSEPHGDLSAVSVRLPESLRSTERANRPLAPPVWLQ
ncbi:MAG: hypothetical protein KatS3mg020_0442 [Fimbriimonadales bacterium]|nr:MAG: hypothetical protein KatS3mg020_0442 [Fimbriimonadales bacterium]